MDVTGQANATLRVRDAAQRSSTAAGVEPRGGPAIVVTPSPAVPPAPDPASASEPGAGGPPPGGAPPGAAEPGESAAGPGESAAVDLREAVRRLRNAVAALPLELDVPEVVAARRERELMLAQFDDYLLPRLARMDAPLLAVIGGSTGAGKSTLTNSLARKVVSRSGVLRPTTRSPVLVHHPHDSGAFLTQRILPNLARITSEALEPVQPIELDAPRITAVRLVPHDGVTAGLALLDAPDIDSLVEANRELAVQLLGAADLWLFVTTATRYGDAMPWEMLRTAVERGVSVAVVLDRVPPESLQEVRADLARRLRGQGLGSSPMFVIPEQTLIDGMLPAPVVAPLKRWLTRLAMDAPARDVVVRRTLAGILGSLPARTRRLVLAAAGQETAAHRLGTELDAVFAAARSALRRQLVDGSVLRGRLLARWQEFLGTGELVRQLERSGGRLSDRFVALVRKPVPLRTETLREALLSAVAAIVGSGVSGTVDLALLRWRELPAGTALAEALGAGPPVGPRAETLAADWYTGVLAAVADLRAQGGREARWSGVQPDSVAVLAALAACAGDGVTGREVSGRDGTAGGAGRRSGPVSEGTRLGRQVLDRMYGEAAVQLVIDGARRDLRQRLDVLLDAERAALQTLLDLARVRPGLAESVRAAAKVVEDVR